MVACIKEKASAHEVAKSTAQRAVGRSVKHNWDCSQIENEEEEEGEDWQKEDQIRAQWDEEQKLEESLGTKKDGRKLLAAGGHAKGTRI